MTTTSVENTSNSSIKSPFITIDGTPIYFSEDWDTGIGGGLWSTGIAMAKYFDSHASSVRKSLCRLATKVDTQNKSSSKIALKSHKSTISAIELGSGNGCLAVCLAAIASDLISELVVTDLADHLHLMVETVHANPHLIPSCLYEEERKEQVSDENNNNGDERQEHEEENSSQQVLVGSEEKEERVCAKGSNNDCQFFFYTHSDHTAQDDNTITKNDMKCVVMEHKWGDFPSNYNIQMNPSKGLQYGSDTNVPCNQDYQTIPIQLQRGQKQYDFIFGSDVAYRNLGPYLIQSLLQLSHEHTICLIGITMIDTKPSFFQALNKAGFTYDRIADHCLAPEFRGTTFGLFVIRRKKGSDSTDQ